MIKLARSDSLPYIQSSNGIIYLVDRTWVIVRWSVKEHAYKGQFAVSRILTHTVSDELSNHGSAVALMQSHFPIKTPPPPRLRSFR